ncbi:T9SS C-terminal target domain-containing protein, partial [Paenimyroides tangerinum]
MIKNYLYIFILFITQVAFSQTSYHRVWSVKENRKMEIGSDWLHFIHDDVMYYLDPTTPNSIQKITLPECNVSLLGELGTSTNTQITDLHFNGLDKIFIVGNTTQSSNFSTEGVYRTIYEANDLLNSSGFVACFTLTGELLWCSYSDCIEPVLQEYTKITTDPLDNVYFVSYRDKELSFENSPFQSEAKEYDGIPFTEYTATVTKLNNQGQFVWGTFFGAYFSFIIDIKAVNDGIIFLGGILTQSNIPLTEDFNPLYFSTPGAYQANPNLNNDGMFSNNIFMNKFNFDGTRAWGTYVNEQRSSLPRLETSSNEIYVISSYNNTSGGFVNSATPNAFITDPGINVTKKMLDRFSADGTSKLWRTYTSNNIFSAYYDKVTINTDGNIWLTGQTDSFTGISTADAYQIAKNPAYSYNLSHSDGYHLLLSKDGSTVLYATYFGFDGKDEPRSLFPTTDGYYSIEKTSKNSNANNFITQGSPLNPDEVGANTYGGTIYTRFTTDLLSSDTFDKKKISIYPNPTTDVLHITGELQSFTKLEMHNMLGQKVLQQSVNNEEIVSVNTESISVGVYLL